MGTSKYPGPPKSGLTAGHAAGELLKGLTMAQREAVTCSHAPLCVLAGAGSGKTTVLTRRVARRILEGSADAGHTMVLTFTRRAANEVRRRLLRLGIPGEVRVGTFHAAAYAQLRESWSERGGRPPMLTGDPVRIVRDLLRARFPATGPSSEVASRVVSEIHWARVKLISPSQYPEAAAREQRSTGIAPGLVAELYESYANEKRRRGVLDLDDLVEECALLLEQNPEQARRRRWQVRHLFVDEFQDLNPAQWRLLEAWRGGRDDLFAVGDPFQAVYGWNGSDPRFIERFSELLPGSKVLRMEENHRSSPQIVSVAKSLLEPTDSSSTTSRHLEPDDLAEVHSPDGPPPTLRRFATDEEEAIEVARWLRRAHKPGRTWSQLAVVARTNARLEKASAALGRLGIPHRVGSSSNVGSDMGYALRCLGRARPDQPLRNALAELVAAQSETEPAREEGRSRAPGALPPELHRLADEHAREEPVATVRTFLCWLSATVAGEELDFDDTDRVDLSTFHKAKGLEWRGVAVIGLEDAVVPSVYAVSDAQLEEERRLLYVALTRAEEELWCSWAAACTTQGREFVSGPSVFIECLERAVEQLRAPCDAESSRSKIGELRSLLATV